MANVRALLVFPLAILIGCQSDDEESAIQMPDESARLSTQEASTPPSSEDSGMRSADGCIAVVDPRACCTTVVAVERTELQEDPCLVPWASSSAGSEAGPECQPDLEECALVDCAPTTPTSRTAERSSNGVCELVDECQDHDDCADVPEDRACACCQSVVPAALLSEGSPELSCARPASCDGADCYAPYENTEPTCRLQAHGLRACQPGPTTCDEREKEAELWLAHHNNCTRDEQCELVKDAPGCLSPFLCTIAISTVADRDIFLRGASELVDEYSEDCGTCASADCADPSSLEAVCRDHRCTIE